jgi:hypothetical protein
MYYISTAIEFINNTSNYDWMAYAGMLELLFNHFQECSRLLTKIKNESSPKPISFLVDTSHIITPIKIETIFINN